MALALDELGQDNNNLTLRGATDGWGHSMIGWPLPGYAAFRVEGVFVSPTPRS